MADKTTTTILLKVDGEEKEIAVKDITFDHILDYCDEHNELEWLDKATSENESYLKLRNVFLTKFFPDRAPVHKAKAPSMKDKIAARMASKKDA